MEKRGKLYQYTKNENKVVISIVNSNKIKRDSQIERQVDRYIHECLVVTLNIRTSKETTFKQKLFKLKIVYTSFIPIVRDSLTLIYKQQQIDISLVIDRYIVHV